MLDLYFFPTPNSRKVTILLEECGLPYDLKIVHIGRGDQFHPDFLKISPNNRMPALVDTDTGVAIFESAAIMMYVAEKAGKFWPQDAGKKYEVVQWLFWQMANQGPKMGEQGHFQRAAAEKNGAEQKHGDLTYPIRRFNDEVHRLFGVLNLGLHKKQWLAAGEYTIADMICYPWAALWKSRGIDIAEFPNVGPWLEAIAARPAVQKTADIGKELYQGPDKMPPDEREKFNKLLGNQRAVAIPAEWK